MKKMMTLMVFSTLFGCISCSKDDDNSTPPQAQSCDFNVLNISSTESYVFEDNFSQHFISVLSFYIFHGPEISNNTCFSIII
jgi:hypothetical protein